MLASSLELRCGPEAVSADALTALYHLLTDLEIDPGFGGELGITHHILSSSEMFTVGERENRDLVRNGQSPRGRLFSLIQRYATLKYADPIDHIYAILSLGHASPFAMTSNYTRPNAFAALDYILSVREVYVHAMKYIVSILDRLEIMCDAIHFPARLSPTDLP